MKKIINPYTVLYSVGVLQPVSVGELREFVAATFSEAGGVPSIHDFRALLSEQVRLGRAIQISSKGRQRFSLTEQGNLYLSPPVRRLRDKLRVYLLRDGHRGRITSSRVGSVVGLVGDSPTTTARTNMKVGASNKLGLRSGSRAIQVYWTRPSRQFLTESGPASLTRDTLPPIISFSNLAELKHARLDRNSPAFDFIGIGLCLGLSPALISKLAHEAERYYRSFLRKKKGGGARIIQSPRLFLKVVQWFLADCVLPVLPVSEAVHSFRSGRSIVSNAQPHERKAFVANIDISDFFGSVTRSRLRAMLVRRGFSSKEAIAISRLTTLAGSLPQGAPTSPILSNAFLFEFDNHMMVFSRFRRIAYTRYADDMTFSGESRSSVEACIREAGRRLSRLGLSLNSEKTRIANRGGQQRVAGVVVNEEAAPSRIMRRKIRAAFHNAAMDPALYQEKTSELGGYIGYLGQFAKFSHSDLLDEYRDILRRVSVVRRIALLGVDISKKVN